MAEQTSDTQRHPFKRGLYTLLLVGFIIGGAFIVAYDALIPAGEKVALEEGQVAPNDVLAPRGIKYESTVLTQIKRDGAVSSVRPVYDPPDVSIANEQLQLVRQVLDYIENIRYDDFASLEQKKADIAAITGLHLDEATIDALLSIEDDAIWHEIDAQVIRLLERVMSGEVREDNLQAKKDNLPNLISATYGEKEVRIINGIVSDLIRVNTFYNDELTRQAQEQVADNVPVEIRTFERGQMIIREGEIATVAHIEALDQFGLLQLTQRQTNKFFSGLLVMILLTAVIRLYLKRFYPDVLLTPSFLILLGLLFLLFLGGARLINTENQVQPYYFPAAALAFLVTTVVGAQLAIVMIVGLAALVGFMSGHSLEFAVLIGFSGTLGVLSLERIERLNTYFVAGGVVGIASACVAVVFALGSDNSVEPLTVLLQIGGSVANGILSAAGSLFGLYVVSNALNIPTSLKIVELMQPNHPLLERLLREAPGTYQHSLQVANLAELGAQRINADAPLVRVAAMYHDVGKILNPHFFVENQVDGVNPHDLLCDPHQSARIIIGHIAEGDRLARRYRLPGRIREFINEHHGTTQVMFFYQQALETEEPDTVRIEDFTYPGPRPGSRETAILMLADGCESSVRARRPQSKQDVQETVDYIFETRLRDRQLDESGLTLNDLRTLRETFLAALQAVFHVRIPYPGTPGQVVEALHAGDMISLPPVGQQTVEPGVEAVVGKFDDSVSVSQTKGASDIQ